MADCPRERTQPQRQVYVTDLEVQGDTTLVAVKIRLKRMGKIRTPFYRIIVSNAQNKRDGRVIEEIGTYNPKTEPSTIHVASERAQYWLGVGAQPTEPVAAILKTTGDLGGGPSAVKEPEPGKDKAAIFQEALQEFYADSDTSATSSKKSMSPAGEQDDAPASGKKTRSGKQPAKKQAAEAASGDEAGTDDSAHEAGAQPEGAADTSQTSDDEQAEQTAEA